MFKCWNCYLGTKIYQVIFFVNVFLFNISSWNCYHKHDVYNLIYIIFFIRKRHFRQCGVKSVANISRKTKNHKCTCKTSTWFSSICYVCGNSFKMKCYIRKHFKKRTLYFFVPNSRSQPILQNPKSQQMKN